MSNTKSDKEKELQNQINEELKRENIEQYAVGAIGKIAIIPTIILICCFLYMLYLFFTNQENDPTNGSFIGGIVWLFILYIIPLSLNDNWEKKLEIKRQLNQESKLNYEFNYDDDLYYTDSLIKYITYSVFKILFYLINAGVVLFLIFLLFSWLGAVSIAPTTIIIILLIIIIINQSER